MSDVGPAAFGVAFRPVACSGLPIFRADTVAFTIFYTPGSLCLVAARDAGPFEALLAGVEHEGETFSRDPAGTPPSPMAGALRTSSDELRRRAAAALEARQRQLTSPFSPECLTLYLHTRCNLRCGYCYAAAAPSRTERLDLHSIRAAAELVAAHCRRKGRPLTVVFHGGGEPTLDQPFAEQASVMIDQVARAHEIATYRYVATNGVMPAAKADWLARRFDLVGLSCDGPAEVQNAQRPRWGGGATAGAVERTARALRAAGRPIHVRVTITPQNVRRQEEVVAYICRELDAQEIHFEPVYTGGRAGVRPDDHSSLSAEEFVAGFLRARQVARQHGVALLYAGSRPGALHGPYCHIYREVLNLVPGGVATACFKLVEAAQAQDQAMVIGQLDEQAGEFFLDAGRIASLRQRMAELPGRCHSCFNRYHCAGACPDQCYTGHEAVPLSDAGDFRCRVQRALSSVLLHAAAEELWAATTTDAPIAHTFTSLS